VVGRGGEVASTATSSTVAARLLAAAVVSPLAAGVDVADRGVGLVWAPKHGVLGPAENVTFTKIDRPFPQRPRKGLEEVSRMSYTGDVDKRTQASDAKRAQGLDENTKIWNVFNVPDRYEAIGWVNAEPAQSAGEAVFSNCGDGSVDVYYFL
jgi:hypothetical protein